MRDAASIPHVVRQNPARLRLVGSNAASTVSGAASGAHAVARPAAAHAEVESTRARERRHLGATGELSEAQLVVLVRVGDVAAFEVLYRRHAGFAANLAVRIQGSVADVEDVVHDAFLRAHQRIDELRDGAAFRSWLGSIVVTLVRSRLRRRRLLGALGLVRVEPVDLDAVASPDASPETRALVAQIYALLHTLPPDDRIAWTLRHVESHRLDAVAELTQCSLATAKRRIGRAQQFLSAHFVAPFAETEARAVARVRVP